MRGLSSFGTESLQKMAAWYYYFVETTETCPWTGKTFRLSSVATNDTGDGFLELTNATSAGYAFYNFTLAEPFGYAYESTGDKRPYFYTLEAVTFPKATLQWQATRQLCLMGTEAASISTIPGDIFIAGYEFSSPLIVGANQQLVFVAGNIQIILRTDYT